MKINVFYFSPTGGTKKAAQHLAGALGGETVCTDLTVHPAQAGPADAAQPDDRRRLPGEGVHRRFPHQQRLPRLPVFHFSFSFRFKKKKAPAHRRSLLP